MKSNQVVNFRKQYLEQFLSKIAVENNILECKSSQ